MANVILGSEVWGFDKRESRHWYQQSDYIKVYIAYNSMGLPYENRTKCRLWLARHLAGEIIIDSVNNNGFGDSTYFYFSDEADVVAFKLSEWGATALEWDKQTR